MRAVLYYQRRAQLGVSIERAARELGLSKASLLRWVRQEEHEEKAKQARAARLHEERSTPVFHAVTVAGPEPEEQLSTESRIVLRGPGEWRIEGLAVTELAELLRALR